MLLVATPLCSALSAGAALAPRIDAALDERAASAAYGELRSFGCVRSLPLPPEPLSVSALSELTALPASAFVPEPRAQPSERDAVFAGAAVIAAELLLSAGTMEGHLSVRGLRELEGWQLPPLLVGLGASAILLGALVDRLVLRGFVLQSVAFALQPRDAVFAHEAGHFLAAYLLGVPAASLQLSPFAVGRGKGYLARVVWHSAEWDLAASAADTRRHSVVLMAGIAAEALCFGRATGGGSDERALRELVLERAERTGVPATSSSGDQARWATANAVLLLRENADALDALRGAMARGASAGECAMVVDDVVRRRPD